MISTNDLKNGITIEVEGAIYVVMDTQHVKPGKGAAIVKAKLKNLRTGAIFEKTFNAGVKVATAHIDKQLMQYLYTMSDVYYFMNMDTYEQLELSKDVIGDNAKYLKENLEVYITMFEGEVLGIDLPDKVELTVTRTEAADRDSSQRSHTARQTAEHCRNGHRSAPQSAGCASTCCRWKPFLWCRSDISGTRSHWRTPGSRR